MSRIVTLPEAGSTNDELARRAAAGSAEGLWVRAERQTAGRGRQGRSWVSVPGNLYASTLVRLRPGDPPAATLALAAALALDDEIAALVPRERIMLKWPNDLLVDGAKLSGILLELHGVAVVIGVGVNLAGHPPITDRPVTSLPAIGVAAPEPARFIEALAASFARWLAIWRDPGLAAVRDRWSERAHAAGTPLVASTGGGETLAGRYEGLAEDGALKLRLPDGTARVIHAADVFMLRS